MAGSLYRLLLLSLLAFSFGVQQEGVDPCDVIVVGDKSDEAFVQTFSQCLTSLLNSPVSQSTAGRPPGRVGGLPPSTAPTWPHVACAAPAGGRRGSGQGICLLEGRALKGVCHPQRGACSEPRHRFQAGGWHRTNCAQHPLCTQESLRRKVFTQNVERINGINTKSLSLPAPERVYVSRQRLRWLPAPRR